MAPWKHKVQAFLGFPGSPTDQLCLFAKVSGGAAPDRYLSRNINESCFPVNKKMRGKRREIVHLEPSWRRPSRQAKILNEAEGSPDNHTPMKTPVIFAPGSGRPPNVCIPAVFVHDRSKSQRRDAALLRLLA